MATPAAQVPRQGPLPTLTRDEVRQQLARVDTARYLLSRQRLWARRTLRGLHIVEKNHGTLSVDKWLRMYTDPRFVSTMGDDELRGVVWHEVNHVLRRHHDRLSFGPEMDATDHMAANVSADCEINQDLQTQGIVLPPNVVYPDNMDLEPGRTAEHYYETLKKRWAEEDAEAERQWRDQQQQQEYDDEGEDDEDGYGDPDGDQQGGDGDQDGQPGDGPPQPGGGGGTPQPGDGPLKPGDDSGPAGGGADDGSRPPTPPSPGNSPDAPPAPRPPKPERPNPKCGSGSGNEALEEDPEPDGNTKARVNREKRRQAEDIVQEVAEGGGYSAVGEETYKAAVEYLGKAKHDWRKTMATVIRNAFEKAMDDAEESTFRRPSRRAVAIPDVRLPSGYRPVPLLWVIIDVSGSMDKPKVEAALRETHGILDRLAMPVFEGLAWNTDLVTQRPVQGHDDIAPLVEFVGGGTSMVSAIGYAYEHGAEVVIVLTDADCAWTGIAQVGRPLIIGGIKRKMAKVLPTWAKVVDVED